MGEPLNENSMVSVADFHFDNKPGCCLVLMLLDWWQESITIVRVVVGVFRVFVLYYNSLE